jgi:HK97 gp10 family phage protein
MSFEKNPNIDNIIKGLLKKALKDSAVHLEKTVEKNAPVDTGVLQRSIKKDYSQLDDASIVVYSDVEYAPMVEFGTSKQGANPFMRSSLKESEQAILNKFKDIL